MKKSNAKENVPAPPTIRLNLRSALLGWFSNDMGWVPAKTGAWFMRIANLPTAPIPGYTYYWDLGLALGLNRALASDTAVRSPAH